MRAPRLVLAAILLASLVPLTGHSADEPPARDTEALFVDAAGKEQKAKGWKWVSGTRRLTWLAQKDPIKRMEPAEEKKGKVPPRNAPLRPAVGPEALEFRTTDSTTYANGVVTLIPLDRLSGLEYDTAKKTVTAKFATGGEPATATLTGSTIYKGSNQFALEIESDRGAAGVAAIRLPGGGTTGFQKATFPTGKIEAPKPGPGAFVTVVHDKQKVTQLVTDLQPLYQLATGAEVVAPALLFKKSLRVELGELRKLTSAAPGAIETTFEATRKDGSAETLTLLNRVQLDGKEATFVGLLGRVPGAWKVFPAHTLTEVEFDARK